MKDLSVQKVLSIDSMLQISRGAVIGISHVNKFGRNPIIDTATDPEDIWDAGGLWVPPTAARTHNIASSSANDAGTVVSTGTADTGSNTTTLYDASADFVGDGVAAGDVVLNDTNTDHSVVSSVTDANTLALEHTHHHHKGFFSHESVGFNDGDTYRVVTPASTGASVIHVYGLDSDMYEAEEFIVMNGTNNVATTRTYWRIYRLHNDGAASRTVSNVGNITATAVTDATVTAQINAGNGGTGMAMYTVPKGKTAYMTNFYGSMTQKTAANSADITLRQTKFAGPGGAGSVVEHFESVNNAGTSHFQNFFIPYKRFEEQTDIWVRCDEVTANATSISAGFDLILVDNQSL